MSDVPFGVASLVVTLLCIIVLLYLLT